MDSYPLLRNPLAETLAAGGLGVALIVQKVHSVDIALAAKACGCDALSVDLEHSVIPESAAAQICVTSLHAGVTPLVRVPSLDGHYANRLLDAGARFADTRQATAIYRFTNHGNGSWGG